MATNNREVQGIRIPKTLKQDLSFAEWIERWNACIDVDTAFGLLHCIYSSNKDEKVHDWIDGSMHGWKPKGHDAQRHFFLLRLADGHNGNSEEDNPKRLPLTLKEKAFSVLVQNFLKTAALNPILELPSELTDELFKFFSRSGRQRFHMNVRWDSPKQQHAEVLASEFLKEFCKIHWWHEGSTRRAQVIELLSEHEALHILMPGNRAFHLLPQEWEKFDELSLKKLEELALAKHKTLEEAVYDSVPAARLLSVVRAGLKGKKIAEVRP